MDTISFLLTLFSAFLWGVSPIITKGLIAKYHRYTIMVLFSATYFLCLLLGMYYYDKVFMKDLAKLSLNDILLILVQGVVILFFGNVIYYYVLKDNDCSIITALQSCSPFFTLILAYWLLNEKIHLTGLIGIALIVMGVIFISYNDSKISIIDNFYVHD